MKLNESPSIIRAKFPPLEWSDSDSFPFGYIDKQFVATKNKMKEHQHLNPSGGRRNMKYPGRVWIKNRVISFWKYPESLSKLKQIAKDINEFFGVNILQNWKIEIVDNNSLTPYDKGTNIPTKLIPILDYKGSTAYSDEELETQHILSPMLKQDKQVPKTVGSNKGSQSLEFQKKYTSESLKQLIAKIIQEELNKQMV